MQRIPLGLRIVPISFRGRLSAPHFDQLGTHIIQASAGVGQCRVGGLLALVGAEGAQGDGVQPVAVQPDEFGGICRFYDMPLL